MQVIVDYFQISQMKSCRKEPQRSRNYLLQQRTSAFNKIQNSFLVYLLEELCKAYATLEELLLDNWGILCNVVV